MLISAVVVPLILLAAVLAPGVYEDWKRYVRQTRLPLPPARRSLRTRLISAAAACLRRLAVSASEPGGTRRSTAAGQ